MENKSEKIISNITDRKQLIISSHSFANGGIIPKQYTCDGKNISPPLHIEHLPANTISLALIVEDPDAPAGNWVHWLVWNIPPVSDLKENEQPGTEGLNDFKFHRYGGPCPPDGSHRYFFKIFALDTLLNLPVNTIKAELENAMNGHIIARGELMGSYDRQKHHF